MGDRGGRDRPRLTSSGCARRCPSARTSTGSRPTSTWPRRCWPGRSPRRSAARSTNGCEVVSDLLVAPVLPLIGDRRVVLTPSGQLSGTPWTLLPGLAGRPVTVPPSATRWLDLRRAAGRRRPRVGLVAGPAVERGEEEVTRAAAAWPQATVLTGERAAAATWPRWRRRSTCSTWRGTAGTPATTRCSRPSSWPTGRGSDTTSTSSRTPPAWWCSPRASSAGPRSGRETRWSA